MTAVGEGRTSLRHIPALDGARGLAVAAVLLFHAGHLDGGYLGVDLFFVLSGFLITALLLAEHESRGAIALGAFWARRARRLLPALLALLAVVSLHAALFARAVDLGQIRGDALATLFYVANWRTILAGSSYWDLSLAPSPLQHTWSLAIEEQFYLVWPLAVLALAAWAARSGAELRRVVGWAALGGAAVSAALFVGLYRAGASATRVYEGTDTRATAILLGVALAAWRPEIERVAPKAREALGAVAVLALGVAWVRLGGQSPWLYRGGLPVASALGAIALAGAMARGDGPLARVLSWSPLRGLGLISYGLYLWHWPLFVWIDQRPGRLPLLGDRVLDGPALLGLKLGVALLAAVVSYLVIEQPVRRGALPGQVGLTASLAGVGGVAVLIVVTTAGAVAPIGEGDGPRQAAVRVDGPTVMVVGDSVAESLVRPIVADPVRYGVNPIDQSELGCSRLGEDHRLMNFAGAIVEQPPCRDEPVVDGLPPPDVVVLYLGARPNDWIEVDGEFVRACDPRYDRTFRASMIEWLERLTPGDTPSVVPTVPRSGREAIPVQGAEERIACLNEVLAEVVEAVPGAHLLDMDELVCPTPGAPCVEELAGAPLRSDGVHYDDGPAGAAAAEWLVGRVADLTGVGPR